MFIARSDRALTDLASHGTGTSVTLGTFDGVHQGHQHLIARTLALRPVGGLAVACTFDPHPTRIVRPEHAPPMIESLEARLRRFAAAGLDGAFVQYFDAAAADEDAEAFVSRILIGALRARAVVVGDSFHFGRGRHGNVALLQRMGAQAGFVVHGADAVVHGDTAISSTRVRTALQQGDVALANVLLGHRYCIEGEVVHGDARGRTLGFPTANVAPAASPLLPHGIYAAVAVLPEGRRHAAALSIGVHPTFTAASSVKVEAYLIDVEGIDLYGAPLHIEVVARLRGEEHFASVPALVQQMHRDVAAVRALALLN